MEVVLISLRDSGEEIICLLLKADASVWISSLRSTELEGWIFDPARRSVFQLCVQKAMGGQSLRFHPLAVV